MDILKKSLAPVKSVCAHIKKHRTQIKKVCAHVKDYFGHVFRAVIQLWKMDSSACHEGRGSGDVSVFNAPARRRHTNPGIHAGDIIVL